MILLILLLFTSTAYADTYEKVDKKTIKVIQTNEQVLDIDYIKSERQRQLDACQAQASQYDLVINEAKKQGVE